MKIKRYNFNITLPYSIIPAAGGIAVHAASMEEARIKARMLLRDGEVLRKFRDNSPCLGGKCAFCD